MKKEEIKSPKKAFEKPTVKPLGSVVDITRGPKSGGIDSIFGGNGGFQDPVS